MGASTATFFQLLANFRQLLALLAHFVHFQAAADAFSHFWAPFGHFCHFWHLASAECAKAGKKKTGGQMSLMVVKNGNKKMVKRDQNQPKSGQKWPKALKKKRQKVPKVAKRSQKGKTSCFLQTGPGLHWLAPRRQPKAIQRDCIAR